LSLQFDWIVFAGPGRSEKIRSNTVAALSPQEIKERQAALPDWQIEGGELVRTFAFKDFRASLAFVNQVGEAAESAGHHPDIDIRYNRVRLALVTHDAGGLTAKDFDLAAQANRLG
jgi:4a-hydroxytetrahydrobiopterin dehydratase